MKVEGNPKVQGTPAAGNQAIPARAKKGGSEGKSSPALVRDSVEISAEGRARAEKASLSPERVQSMRQRILEGAYHQADVVDAVARKILSSGDV
jgi:hypothetical protein